MIPESTAAAESRSSEQTKKSHDEANSSGAVNHSEDESGNENQQKNVRRRKRAHKGSENVKRKRARAGCSRVGRARGRRGKRRHVENVTLFEVITMGRSAMRAVIDDWIQAYVTDRDSSLLDLISFFIHCCGCKGVVTAEMCQSKEDSDVMSKMVEELDEVASMQYKKFLAFPWILTVTWPMDTDSVEYPLTQSGPYGRWFHSEFCDFVSVLVAQCQHSVLFDSYLMNTLISLLTELSNSYIRAFRHTCTLAAVKLLSALVGVALSLSVGIENSQKLCKVQKTKTTRQKVTPQLERVQKKIAELQGKRVEIESMMDIVFKGVFLKRYRDVLPEIRSICVEELGLWMKLYSSEFLNDTYLKYMGWMMYDKIPDVRLKCVLGLQRLFEDPLLLPKLDLFTSRFKGRLISMTLDRDNEVSVQTMKLLLLISRTCDDVLSPGDYKQLLQLVYSSQRPLAAAAGELLYLRLLSSGGHTSDSQDEINEEEAHRLQTSARLKSLLQYHQESELHKHVVYLVDSLWDCGGALLKDWAALTSLLLQEPSSHGPGLTLAEQALLVEILVASVRQASEGPALAGRSGAKKAMNAREKKLQIDDCTKLTQHLLTVLPKLLNKFSSSADVVASLLRIPQFFIPECPEAENTQALSSLVAELGAVLDFHSGPAVVEAAARTYLSLCGGETSCGSVARDARDSLVQTWVDKLTALLEDSLQVGDCFSADEEKTEDILSTLRKLRAFHNCHDLARWSLFQLLSPLLSAGGAPPEVLMEVLQCLCFFMIWSLNGSSGTLTSRAFLGVCDVLVAHSYQTHVWDPTSFGPLLHTPSPKLQRALSTFVCMHVFVGSDCDSQSRVSGGSEVERLEDLHRRRNLLAAFCKLIVHGVLEMSTAAEVFMYYTKYYNDFGDIIKETMCRARQTDKIESSRTLVLCLQQLFVRLKKEQQSGGRAQAGVQTFTSIKELARRFALTFGDPVKFRECVVVMHRTGIEFVFQEFIQIPETPTPPLLSYLTILSEFSSKLLKPDKKTVFMYLQKHTAELFINLRDECWQPLVYYRASLLTAAEGEDAVSGVSSDRKPCLPNRSPFSKQKLEGSKSPCQFSPVDSKVCKGHRSTFSPSHQEKTTDVDPLSIPLEPAARGVYPEGSVLSSSNEAEDDTVEIEL
ncbi:cohesin subunit SA-2 isoform X3 [Platichthys flesus]|uniref:cohesin subunit SA-2 isoform X3 n=1 Tax=Platichthys flesus TaxID=8260 RepID=UPI002DBA5770|nr:cohesin subunit SA-2 isoform X3 [Platichthys flesus]